ncbi:MAG TPA: hypothetical protein VHB47_11335 [Thermoanaerobaculia bacterium]|nr:hypothetical protein [Thermoanaerobaculia bacterium]
MAKRELRSKRWAFLISSRCGAGLPQAPRAVVPGLHDRFELEAWHTVPAHQTNKDRAVLEFAFGESPVQAGKILLLREHPDRHFHPLLAR